MPGAMQKLLCRILVNALAFYAAAALMPAIRLDGLWAALLAGAVLAVINLIIRPLLVIVTFPINLLTLGLFTFVVNTWMVMLADRLIGGLRIPGFWLSLLIALILSVLNYLFHFMASQARIPLSKL